MNLLKTLNNSRACFKQKRFPELGTIKRFGLEFTNPVGLAAGFDKTVPRPCAEPVGFEVGTVTNEAQPGNPGPRLFRLPQDRALINRLGFNNLARRVGAASPDHRPVCVLGVNIGKSCRVAIEESILTTSPALQPCTTSLITRRQRQFANTPNRNRKDPTSCQSCFSRSEKNNELAQASSGMPKPLLLKIAPDLINPKSTDHRGRVAR
jgi:dihydroorotate dehydrogenase